ncbi:hypothetical protein GGS24DRAFT_495507 [Hypoxylon argillaceum]|nr:hypothetical protein GGS24DRAFT_495507 [Hypoxylon argillaceum]
MSNLGPLPTNFLNTSNCQTALNDIYYVDNNYLLQGNNNQLTCYPNGYAGNTAQYYSPARCPSGFTQACSSTNRIDTLVETISICCPTEHVFVCQSTSSLTWESTLGCVSQHTQAEAETIDVIVASDGSTSPYTIAIGALGAYSIQVRYQSTDFISSTSSAQRTNTRQVSATSTSTSTSSTNTSTGGTSDRTTSSSDSNGGISAGAAAGIAVGAFAGFLIVIAVVWYLVKQKRRQSQPGQNTVFPGKPGEALPLRAMGRI